MVTLASNLLPSLPSTRPGASALGGSTSAARAGAERSEAGSARGEALVADHVARVSFLADNPALLQSFAQGLLPLMLEVRPCQGQGSSSAGFTDSDQ